MARKPEKWSQGRFDREQTKLGVAPVEAPGKRLAMSRPEDQKRGINAIVGPEGVRNTAGGGSGGRRASPKPPPTDAIKTEIADAMGTPVKRRTARQRRLIQEALEDWKK